MIQNCFVTPFGTFRARKPSVKRFSEIRTCVKRWALLVAALGVAAPAQAVLYTLDWTGLVRYGAWGGAVEGDTVHGSITIDTDDVVVGFTEEGPVIAELLRSSVLYIGGHRLQLAMEAWHDLNTNDNEVAISDAVVLNDRAGGGLSLHLDSAGQGGWGFETWEGGRQINPQGDVISVTYRTNAAHGNAAPVPEPSTLLLLGLGLAGARLFRRRSRSRAATVSNNGH